MTTESPQADLIRQLEEQLLRPEVRMSAAQVSDLLADGFIEFGASGRIYDKKQIIDLLQQEQGRGGQRTVKNFFARELAADVVLATYRIVESQTIRSSIWKLTNGRWRMEFHQGTRANVT
jgi:hypothetical protein